MADTSTFLALDLGGTNLRVCEVRLLGNHKFELKQQKYKVSDDLKEGEARVLFGESRAEAATQLEQPTWRRQEAGAVAVAGLQKLGVWAGHGRTKTEDKEEEDVPPEYPAIRGDTARQHILAGHFPTFRPALSG